MLFSPTLQSLVVFSSFPLKPRACHLTAFLEINCIKCILGHWKGKIRSILQLTPKPNGSEEAIYTVGNTWPFKHCPFCACRTVDVYKDSFGDHLIEDMWEGHTIQKSFFIPGSKLCLNNSEGRQYLKWD